MTSPLRSRIRKTPFQRDILWPAAKLNKKCLHIHERLLYNTEHFSISHKHASVGLLSAWISTGFLKPWLCHSQLMELFFSWLQFESCTFSWEMVPLACFLPFSRLFLPVSPRGCPGGRRLQAHFLNVCVCARAPAYTLALPLCYCLHACREECVHVCERTFR